MSDSHRAVKHRSNLLDTALNYAACGWRIIPLHDVAAGSCSCGKVDCGSAGKHPRTAKGAKDGTVDTATIRRWWARWPAANIGVCTGPESGVWMLGPDGRAGIDALAELVRGHGQLPPTPSAKSGSGGRHYYFRWPAAGDIGNRKDHRSLPIDVRGAGGYFVAPPSRNKNGVYEWEFHPNDCELADAPPWLLEWVRGDGKRSTLIGKASNGVSIVDRAVAYLAKMPPAISNQGGHDQTMEAARVVAWGFDLGAETAYHILAAHYNLRCQPPWTEKELRHKCQEADSVPFGKPRGWLLVNGQGNHTPNKSSNKQGANPSPQCTTLRVRTVAPYEPFPLEALPPAVRSYVRQGAAALGCDPAYVALPVLAVLASTIGNTRVIRLKRKWTEPAILWTAIVGESGTLKSPAQDLGASHLFTVQERLIAQHKQEYAAYLDELREWKEKKKQHSAGESEDPGEQPEPPVLRRVVVSDITIEKLAEILEDNQRGTLVARDELAGWIGSFTKYKGKQGGSDVPNWLQLNRAGTLIVDRKTGDRRTLYIKRASVSVTGGIQPGVLARALTADLLDSGLGARLLLCWPVRVPKQWSEAEIDPDTERMYHDLLERLLTLDFDERDGRKVPRVLRLSDEAKPVWIDWYNAWAKEQAAVEGELAAAFSKLEGFAARFALIHHVSSCAALQTDDAIPIEADAIEAGIALARWFAGEARRIYSTLSESTEEREIRGLVEFVRAQGGSITVRQLQRSNGRKYPDADTARLALEALVEARLGEWREGPAPARGGHRGGCFVLCPTHDTSDTRSGGPDTEEDSPSDTRSDTRGRPLEKHGKNGRVSEVSCVGTESNGAPSQPEGHGGNSECRSECRTANDREPGAEG
jgi:hypothetical protein